MIKVNIAPALLQENEGRAYERLYENFCRVTRNCKTVAFTSCISREGKSTIAFQVGISLARHGKKVLFIDSDLKNSCIAGTFIYRVEEGERIPGLVQLLAEEDQMAELICSTNVKRFHVISAGSEANRNVELNIQKLAEFIKNIGTIYDYIILDAPALETEACVQQLAKICDGLLLVIESGMLDDEMIMEQKAKLRRSRTPILGAILNMVE